MENGRKKERSGGGDNGDGGLNLHKRQEKIMPLHTEEFAAYFLCYVYWSGDDEL